MMSSEIITGTGLAVALGAKLAYDVCGPTAKYLGGELCSYSKQGISNLKRIFEIAADKLPPHNQSSGQVPPRLLRSVLSEGYFCEDRLMCEYLGGVLASSKRMSSRDDRGLTYLAMLSSMSTYQIRVHYLIYSAIVVSNELPSATHSDYCFKEEQMTILISEEDIISSMEYSTSEDHHTISYHCFLGLEVKGLCGGGTKVVPAIPKYGIEVPFRFVYPTRFGAELFLWGMGLGALSIDTFLDSEFKRKFTSLFKFKSMKVEYGRYRYG